MFRTKTISSLHLTMVRKGDTQTISISMMIASKTIETKIYTLKETIRLFWEFCCVHDLQKKKLPSLLIKHPFVKKKNT